MNWDAISAVGTILAAIVGIAGIWLNLWDKTKKLNKVSKLTTASNNFLIIILPSL